MLYLAVYIHVCSGECHDLVAVPLQAAAYLASNCTDHLLRAAPSHVLFSSLLSDITCMFWLCSLPVSVHCYSSQLHYIFSVIRNFKASLFRLLGWSLMHFGFQWQTCMLYSRSGISKSSQNADISYAWSSLCSCTIRSSDNSVCSGVSQTGWIKKHTLSVSRFKIEYCSQPWAVECPQELEIQWTMKPVSERWDVALRFM